MLPIHFNRHGKSPFIPMPKFSQTATIKLNLSIVLVVLCSFEFAITMHISSYHISAATGFLFMIVNKWRECCRSCHLIY